MNGRLYILGIAKKIMIINKEISICALCFDKTIEGGYEIINSNEVERLKKLADNVNQLIEKLKNNDKEYSLWLQKEHPTRKEVQIYIELLEGLYNEDN